jgi:hypothetical protein
MRDGRLCHNNQSLHAASAACSSRPGVTESRAREHRALSTCTSRPNFAVWYVQYIPLFAPFKDGICPAAPLAWVPYHNNIIVSLASPTGAALEVTTNLAFWSYHVRRRYFSCGWVTFSTLSSRVFSTRYVSRFNSREPMYIPHGKI